MAGTAKPRGAARSSSKKGPTGGTGGKNKRRLEGKGPTPKAEDRPYHAAAKRKKAAEKKAAPRTRTGRSEKPKGEIVSGRNAVLEALRASVPATELIVARSIDVDDRVAESLQLALHHQLPIREVHRAELEGINANSQGIILAIKPYQYSSFQEITERANHPILIVALDGVTDPRNLGAVIRSSAAFGADGVLVPERRAAGMTASAWKTSAGAATRVPVSRAVNLTRELVAFKKAGCTIFGLDADGDVNLTELDHDLVQGPIVLVVGGEATGMSRLVRDTCDQVISIPMFDETESLNAGVAAGVAMYEIARIRNL
jgi:23S rRNA (guanosine2251-2'-O)-methyltransferase